MAVSRVQILSLFLPPLRIITIVILLSHFPLLKISWQTALFFAYYFFPLFGASFIVELILNYDNPRITIKTLYPKYLQSLPLQFVGMAGFAILSFSDTTEAFWLGVTTTVIVIVYEAVIELFHHNVYPRLQRIQMSDKATLISLVPITVFFVYLWFQAYLIVIKVLNL